jgi:hypothetical protein
MFPQGSIATILKPPQNFETVYQGKSRTIPIPFVPVNPRGEFSALDDLAGVAEVASNLVRYQPVPIGSSLLVLIPRALYNSADTLVSVDYRYDLRWRLRTVDDYAVAAANANPTHPWSLVTTPGAPSAPAPTARRVIPAYVSEQVTPTVVGDDRRPLITSGVAATVSQGVYALADFAGITGPPDGGDAALGQTYYPPLLKASVGNEIGICATMATGNWDFGSAAGDAPFSNIYGTNVAGPSHPFYPGVGIMLIVLARSTTP